MEGEALRASREFLRGLVPLLTGGCCLPEEAQDDEGRKSSGNVHSCLSPWGAIGGSAPGHWTPPLTPSWGGGVSLGQQGGATGTGAGILLQGCSRQRELKTLSCFHVLLLNRCSAKEFAYFCHSPVKLLLLLVDCSIDHLNSEFNQLA